MAVYPSDIPDESDYPDAGANLSSNPHSGMHDGIRDEVFAIAGELGIAPKGSYATVKARLDAGWQPIAAAAFSSASTATITVPASTYRMVRVVVQAAVASGVNVLLAARINNDSTAGRHNYFSSRFTSDAVVTNTTATTAYGVGVLNVNQGNVAEFIIYNTHTASACPFVAHAASYHATEANGETFQAGGQLATNLTLSSIVLFPSSSTFTGHYTCEGYVVP